MKKKSKWITGLIAISFHLFLANYFISSDTFRYLIDNEHVSVDISSERNFYQSEDIVYIPKETTLAVVSGRARADGAITLFDKSGQRFYALAHKANFSNDVVGTSVFFSYPVGFVVDSGDGIGELIFNSIEIGNGLLPFGLVDKNEEYGVSGTITTDLNLLPQSFPVAVAPRVKFGFAQIYATLVNGENRLVDILILYEDKSKMFLYRIIDKEFMNVYGGIMYGMSGSPIFQEGRLIGAVSGASPDYVGVGFMRTIQQILK